MIVIDINMPKSCVTCEIMCKHKEKANIRYSRGDFSIPNDCPIKCDIKDIKQEILGLMSHDDYMVDGFNVLEIIDNHIKGDTDANNN